MWCFPHVHLCVYFLKYVCNLKRGRRNKCMNMHADMHGYLCLDEYAWCDIILRYFVSFSCLRRDFFFWCILLGIKGRRPRRVTYQAWETSSLHPDVCQSLMSCSKLARMLGCLRVNTGGLHCYTFLSSFMPGQASMTRRMSEQNRMLSGCLTTCHFMRVTPPMITPNWL